MHAFNRGRAGPRQSTPANVQCQKCLKRGHYSYECKAAPQERPYKARPSRTQQMLNPKLAPKLTNNALDEPSTRKKGVADEELAKKEAERTRKRELDNDDDEPAPRQSERKRQRSESVDSVSTISTRSSRSPPPRRRASPSPRRVRDISPPPQRAGRTRDRSFDSASDRSRRHSLSPETSYRSRGAGRRSTVSRSPSPPRRAGRDISSERELSPPRNRGSRDGPRGTRPQQRIDSRSPRPIARSRAQQDDQGYRRYRERSRSENRGGPTRGQERQRAPPPRQPEPPRERSLSPFSKRLALTQAMNMGR